MCASGQIHYPMRTLQCPAGPILVRIGVGVALTLSVALSLTQVPVPGEQVWGVGDA